jgi:hypothetical protein
MPAPLIEVEDKQPDEKIEIRLRPEVARDLRAYGEYAQGSSASHVVTAALKRLFREDKGFKSFREENPSAGSVKVQKFRKNSPASEKGAA